MAGFVTYPPPMASQYPVAGQYPVPPNYSAQAPSAPAQIARVEDANIASFGRRFLARLIDCALILLAYLPLYLPLSDNGTAVILLALPAWLVSWVLYEWLCVAIAGATVGKKALGIRVVDQLTGALLGFGPAFVRAVIPVAGALPAYVGTLLVYLSPLFDRSGRMQGWHDKAANDLVVLKRR